jgi:hypothetical protein
MRPCFTFSLRPIWVPLALVLSFGAGCTVANPNHCGNQSGHATCRSRSESLPYCNLCTATNDGCTDEAPVESRCQPDDEPLEPATGSTSMVASTSTDGSDAPATSSTTADRATGDGSTTDTGATTTDGGSERGDETSTTEATTGDTEGQVCGNDIREGTEECDGEDFGGATCQSVKNGDPHWQGELHCTALCKIYDDECCLGVGAPCVVALNNCCGSCGVNLQCGPPSP